jgi:hypothetical protein
MHLKGYFAGIGFLILGLIMLFRNFEKWIYQR